LRKPISSIFYKNISIRKTSLFVPTFFKMTYSKKEAYCAASFPSFGAPCCYENLKKAMKKDINKMENG
jgi:hypothetical protein